MGLVTPDYGTIFWMSLRNTIKQCSQVVSRLAFSSENVTHDYQDFSLDVE